MEMHLCVKVSVSNLPIRRLSLFFLCGNSTVVDQDNEPWASWGQMIPHFFGTDVCIANYAESGESANTFIGAGRLKKSIEPDEERRLSLHGVRT